MVTMRWGISHIYSNPSNQEMSLIDPHTPNTCTPSTPPEYLPLISQLIAFFAAFKDRPPTAANRAQEMKENGPEESYLSSIKNLVTNKYDCNGSMEAYSK